MRPPLSARLIRSLLVAFSVAQFCRVFAGTAPRPALLVMTFAWASIVTSQLTDADNPGAAEGLWPADTALGFLSGQLLWAAPLARVVAPEHWFWLPIQVPSALTAAALVAILCCPLRPFWNRVFGERGALMVSREFDLAILCSGFFVLSGSLVFAVGAAASLTTIIASRLTCAATNLADRKMSHTMSHGVLKTS